MTTDTTPQNDLIQRLETLEARNKRVEMDKAWEGSLLRRATIMIVTYVVVVVFLFIIGNSQPFIGAAVPPLGFYLSTLVVSDLKKYWVRKKQG